MRRQVLYASATAVNLTLADVPKGFSVRFAITKTHLQSARVGGLPVTDEMNGTLLSYSDNGFVNKAEMGLVGIQATVGLFPNSADATKDAEAVAFNLYSVPGVTVVDTGAADNNSVAIWWSCDKGRPYALVGEVYFLSGDRMR